MKKPVTLLKYVLLFIVLFGCSRKKDGIPKLSQKDLSINIPGYNVYENSSLISYLVDSTISCVEQFSLSKTSNLAYINVVGNWPLDSLIF